MQACSTAHALIVPDIMWVRSDQTGRLLGIAYIFQHHWAAAATVHALAGKLRTDVQLSEGAPRKSSAS